VALAIASICCAGLALAFTILGFVLTSVPYAGSVMSFGAPVIAVVGAILGGLALSKARRESSSMGMPITGLVVSVIVFLPAALVALTCGLCNACFSTVSSVGSRGDLGSPAGASPPARPPAAAPPPAAASSPALDPTAPPTAEELARAVHELNEACGDVWCEGEFDYRFQTLTCSAGACTLQFLARHESVDEGAPYAPAQIVVPGAADLLECESGLAPRCDNRVLSLGWMNRMNEAVATWELANRPSPH
jgi:hypothetical protein